MCGLQESEKVEQEVDNGTAVEKAAGFLAERFVDSVKRGFNDRLPISYYSSTSSMYSISTYLGECSKDAQQLLFSAANLAMRDPVAGREAEQNAAVAEAFRLFVKKVAADWASDVAEGYVAYAGAGFVLEARQ